VKPTALPTVLALAGSLLAGNALAQPGAPPPIAEPVSATARARSALAVAFEAAWQRAVAAREAGGQRQRAAAAKAAASSLLAAPPSIEFRLRDDRWQTDAGEREVEAGIVFPLWMPGQRAATGAAAEAGVEQADAATAAARLRIAGEVREAAWDTAALKAEMAGAEEHAQVLKTLAEDVDRRVRAGDLARADALAAHAERLEAEARRADARLRLESAQLRWTALTGQTSVPEPAQLLEEPAGDTTATATHPELRLAGLNADYARRQVDLVRASRREPPELLFGVRSEVPATGLPSQNSVAIGLRIPLGTDARNRPLEAAALAELDVAEVAAQRRREHLAADRSTALAGLTSAQQQSSAGQERAGLLRERAALIERSFRAGEAALPDLLRALSAASQAETAAARQQAAQGLARARLQTTLGVLP
jgi:outer membrane protein TolC